VVVDGPVGRCFTTDLFAVADVPLPCMLCMAVAGGVMRVNFSNSCAIDQVLYKFDITKSAKSS
jgi:hypothetical protein